MKIIWILLLSIICTNAYSQKRDSTFAEKKNNIKINTFSIIFSNTSLFYERRLNDKFSASLGVGLKGKGTLPRILKIDDESFEQQGGKFNGWSITPEFRWYINQCTGKNPMEGFYLSVFGRYNEFNGSSGFTFTNDDGNVLSNNATLKLQDIGAGFMLGYQLFIAKRVSVDFMIFGPRWSHFDFNLEFDTQLDPEFIDKLEELIREKFEEIFNFDDLDLENTDFNYSGSANTPNLRYGVSIGYLF